MAAYNSIVARVLGFLSDTRKMGAVSSAPPKGIASSSVDWRMASAPFALLFSITLISCWTARAQTPPAAQKQAGQQQQGIPDETNPPEEDESVAPKKYVLNPLESERNIKVGNFYWNKKDYRGALDRYKDATRYNPSSAEAFLRVAEAEEKLHHEDAAKAAFQKVISLAPDSKFAATARKKLSSKG